MRSVGFVAKATVIGYGLWVMGAVAMAQNTQSGYFNDGFLYRHEMNPAFGNDQNYIGVPGVANIDVSLHGNMKVDNYFYNFGGKTTTFLNPKVDAGEFMSNVKDKNKLGNDLRVNLLSAGFKAWGGYNTVGFSIRENAEMHIPGELFRFAKEGVQNQTYELGGFQEDAQAWGELAFGHSRQVNDQWRLGGKLKLLFGGANFRSKINHATARLNNDKWEIDADAQLESSLKGLTYDKEKKTRTNPDGTEYQDEYVSGIDVHGSGVSGFGLGVDLGAVYKLNNDWEFSASLLDLGYIRWSNNMKAVSKGKFSTDTYIFNVDDDKPNSFENEWDALKDGLAQTVELQDKGDQGARTTGLGATMNLAASYNLPSYRNLTFGLMNTTRMNGDFSWTEFRLSTNWRTNNNIFSATADVVAGTYGVGFGWLLNVHPKSFNFFVGMDHTLGKAAKPFIPMSGNGHFNVGMNVPF